jgi:hypothetical protein
MIHICGPKEYEFNGINFEFGFCGPWRLKKDGELYKKQGSGWMDKIHTFLHLKPEEQEKYRVGRGCQTFYEPGDKVPVRQLLQNFKEKVLQRFNVSASEIEVKDQGKDGLLFIVHERSLHENVDFQELVMDFKREVLGHQNENNVLFVCE